MRDHGIVPLRSSPIGTLKGRILIPLGITAIVFVLLILLKNNLTKIQVLTAYLLFWFFYAAYVCSGSRKNLIIYVVPCMIVYTELTTSIATPFFYVFRTILPGSQTEDPTFLSAFVKAFFGSGLMEELMKALPALIGLCLAMRSTTSYPPTTHYLDLLRCSTPIEGMLVGLAAGAGFIYVETLYQFTPDKGLYVANPDSFGSGFDGLVLLFQRIGRGVIGHMTWAGLSGFFIGLSARYPRSMVVLLTTGWLLAAILHTLWNVSPYMGEAGRWMKYGLSLLVFVVCFIRAKQLDARGAVSDSC